MGQTKSKITLDQLVAESGVKLESLEKQCSEDKLLDLAEYCDPISVVGHALGITKAQVSAIDNDYRTTKEKRLALMQAWKETFAFQATYKKFIEALLASGKAERATEVCQALAKQASSINVNAASSEDQIVELQSHSSITPDVKPVDNLTSTGASDHSHIKHVPVSGSVPDTPPANSNASVADQIRKLEREYRKIGRSLIKSLKQEDVSLEDLQDYVATLPYSVQQMYEELQTNLLSLQTNKAASVSQFVEAINKYSNVLSPALLADVIEEYGDEETKSMMNEYSEKLEQFQTETQVKQLVGVFRAVTPEGYAEIGLELKDNWEEKTLKDIAPPKLSWILKKVIYGSLRVLFSIADIEDLKEKDVREYLQRHVKRVFVNGKCILNFECDEAISGQTALEESETVQLTEIPSDFRFSSESHGKDIILSEDGLEAHRTGGIYTGVYVATPLQGTCEFEVEVTDCDSSIGGSLLIGVSQCPTGTYKHLDIPHESWPKNSCVWSSGSVKNGLSGDLIETKYGSMSLHDLKTGDKVAMRISENGDLHFLLNNMNEGLASRNVYREGWDTYPVIHVDGICKAVKITRAVIPKYVKGHRGQQSSENIVLSCHNIQFGFHPVTGENIMLLEDGLYARRLAIDVDRGIVYGAMPINHRGTFEVIITEHERGGYDHSINIGVMRQPTNTELKQSYLPAYSHIDGNHFVWIKEKLLNKLNRRRDDDMSVYGCVNLSDLREGDKVGLRLSSDGTLSFFVNSKNQGVAVRGLHQEGYDIYPMVEVLWDCHAVRITRAETHSEEVSDLQELCVEQISSCLDWSSKAVEHLPLPQRLKRKVEYFIEFL